MRDELDETLDEIEEKILEQENKHASWTNIVNATKMALTKCIDNADRPYHIAEWIKLAPFDVRGRKVHPNYLFESQNVKEAVLGLIKQGRVRRLGKMTFYSKRATERIEKVIAGLLHKSCIICDLETIVDMIVEDAKQDVICEKVVGFLEPEIVLAAIDNSKRVARNTDGNVYHKTLIESVATYAYETAETRVNEPVTPEEFFNVVARATSNKQYLWEALHDSFVREEVIQYLRQTKRISVSKNGTHIRINSKKKKPQTTTDRFRSLDDL